ncbi:MAG: DUF2911 domain-containing protein [Flavobacteriaceae bacterium]|nr:DUF2911 domain-containing protein [Flavobacteriaceae bacterium]
MKKLSLITFAFALLLSSNAIAQKFSGLDKSPADIAVLKTSRTSPPLVKVVYSRPQLKGRTVASLAKNGEVWRTGANEASEIVLFKDMKIGGKAVKAGTYSLFTIPGEKEWVIILSSDTNVWGAYGYKEANDVARITVPVSSGDESLEAFSIAYKKTDNGYNMVLGWGTVRVEVPLSH